MLKNEWNAIALNVDEKSPRRNEAALAERQLAHTRKVLEKVDLIREYWSKIPDENKKSFHQVMADFMALVWRYYAIDNATHRFWFTINDCIRDYFAQKIYLIDIDKAVLQYEWIRFHYEAEKGNKQLVETIINKRTFKEFFGSRGIPVSRRIGFVQFREGTLAWRGADEDWQTLDSLWAGGRNEVFCKPELDTQGNGCFMFENRGGVYHIDGTPCNDQDWDTYFSQPKLMEEVVVNHPLLKSLHPQSLNTCRIVTACAADGEIVLLRSMLRMGVGGSTVDNLYHGGLGVIIKPDGTLNELASYHDYTRPGTPAHPDSGVVFKEVKLPYYQEAVALAKKAHSLCGGLRSAGWDVAITPNGPVLIECNVNYSIIARYGGLRHEMVKYFTPAE
ncbi:MAG: sugar-transfer associated ATP-grasp domain-containing protein [Akkermansia sp.]|nr:sugar-transfer associated ATP-grasp domain-containing protein [Akkermansia sp.]